ncbi:MAG: MFS transporter [Calditrichia bacterium]
MNSQEKPQISKQQWRILISLMLGVFMGALDISIVAPAIPIIAKNLSMTQRQIPWIITLYILVYVISTPLMSALSDRYGRKRIFLFNVATFGAGSLWAAFSGGFGLLLAGRGIQALGAGGLFPIATTVIGENIPQQKRGMALGFVGLVWGVAGILGPPLGGWLTQWLGWEAIFFLNIPIAAILLFYAGRALPHDTGVHEHPLDVLGMMLLGSGLASLAYGLNQLHSKDFLRSIVSTNVWPWLAAAVILLVAFARAEQRPRAPIISLRLFVKRQLNIGLYLGFAGGITEAGLVFLPFFAMRTLNIGVGSAGTLMLALALTLFIFTEPMGMLIDKTGVRLVLLIGTFFTGLGAFLLVNAYSVWEFIGFQVVLGIGLSALLGAPVRYVVLSETNDKERASAQGVVSLAGSFGLMTGTALTGAFLASNPNGLHGFREIFWMVALVAAVGFLLSFGLKSKNLVGETNHRRTNSYEEINETT